MRFIFGICVEIVKKEVLFFYGDFEVEWIEVGFVDGYFCCGWGYVFEIEVRWEDSSVKRWRKGKVLDFVWSFRFRMFEVCVIFEFFSFIGWLIFFWFELVWDGVFLFVIKIFG